MKKYKVSSWIVLLGIFFISSCIKEIEPPVDLSPSDLTKKYMVVFDENSSYRINNTRAYSTNKSAQQSKIEQFCSDHDFKGHIRTTYYTALQGFVCETTAEEINKIKNSSEVAWVEEDQTFTLSTMERICSDDPYAYNGPQITPYGITMVNGVPSISTSRTAWILDTGIDLDHPDLNVDPSLCRSFVYNDDNPDDGHGHGTHVAGTIGALNNDYGVIGVAPGVKVVGVKVLNNNGAGSFSQVITGFDYVLSRAKPGDVINLSLGGGRSFTIENAILQAEDTGVIVILSAGNSAADAANYSPGAVNGKNIYTISAVNENKEFASFSNYGSPPIDYAAPGVKIFSTWKNGGYATLSGTSMAAPHAAGVFIIGAMSRSLDYAKNDPDGQPDPIIAH